MRPNVNAALVAGGFVLGGLLGPGSLSARAQAVGGAPPASVGNYTQGSPYGDLGPGVASMARPPSSRTTGTPPGAVRASYPAPSTLIPPAAGMTDETTRASYPAGSTARAAAATNSTPRASDNAGWSVPPQKPKTGLAGLWDRMIHPGDYASTPSRTIYVDPSTGRTDLPLSKPWLKGVTP